MSVTPASAPKALRADAERHRVQIVETAAQVFAQDGFDVPLERVAKEAGVGVGTLYRRFPGRRALVVAVFQSSLQSFVTAAQESQAQESTAWDALVRAMGRTLHLKLALGGNETDRAATYASVKDEPELVHLRREMVRLLEELVTAAQAEGSMRQDVGAGDVARLFSGVRRGPDTSPEVAERVATRTLALVLDALRTGARLPLPGEPVTIADLNRQLGTSRPDSTGGGDLEPAVTTRQGKPARR